MIFEEKNLSVYILLTDLIALVGFTSWDIVQYSGLSISTTQYLEHLSISNYFYGPLNISTKRTLVFPLYLEFLSVSNKNLGLITTIFSVSRTSYLRVL